MLELRNVEVRAGAFHLKANLSVTAGERVAVIGPSGAGKSTLFSVIAGFLNPTAGQVIHDGRDLAGLPPGERPVSILFQDHNLFPHLTVGQNVGLGLSPALRLNPDERMAVSAALARAGLAGFEGRRPATLSGGQQSRAALARALIRRRPILLLDEPFGALGPALRHEMLGLVAEVATDTGAALLMVTHDPDDAMRICPRTIVVAEGMASAPQPTAELLAHPPKVLADYLGK